MKAFCNELIENESGLILSAELVLVLTIAVLGLVTGLSCVQQAVVSELQDLALAFSGLNQSYSTPSYRGCCKGWGRTSWSAGSGFIDVYDGCVGGSGGHTSVGFGSTGQSGVVYGTSEINTGVGCGSLSVTPRDSSSAVLLPQPVPAPAGRPCEGCQTGSEVVIPAPMNPPAHQ
jgi:hypothetical protein